MQEIPLKDIPREWVFETYLKLGEKLEGQEVWINSPFNDGDSTPSFSLFYEKNKCYFFRDFSCGKGGDHVGLVAELEKIPRNQAIRHIVNSYMKYLTEGNEYSASQQMKHKPKYKVTDYKLRTFKRSIDKPFWKDKYQLSVTTLEHFNVAPIEHFIMTKPLEDGKESKLVFDRGLIYGYFNKRGELCKIYRPERSKGGGKFIKVKENIQGADQLRYDCDFLLINKSLKDVMVFYDLKIPQWENVAPDSEGELLPKDFMEYARSRYRGGIYTLMDPDKAGKLAEIKYQEKYGTIPLTLNSGYKDLSDTVEKIGQIEAREKFLESTKKT